MEVESNESFFSDATSSDVGSIFSDGPESDIENEKLEVKLERIEVTKNKYIKNTKSDVKIRTSQKRPTDSSMILPPISFPRRTSSRYVNLIIIFI